MNSCGMARSGGRVRQVTDIGVVLPVIFAAGGMGPLLVDRVTRALCVQAVFGLA